MVWHRASGCFLTLKSPVFRSLIYFKFANVTGRSEWQRGVAEFKKWEVGAPNLPTKSRALQRSPSLTSKLQPNRVAISMLSKGSISAVVIHHKSIASREVCGFHAQRWVTKRSGCGRRGELHRTIAESAVGTGLTDLLTLYFAVRMISTNRLLDCF